MITTIAIGWLGLALGMTLLWWRQVRTQNATSVDVAWSAGLAVLAVVYPWAIEGDLARRVLVSVLAATWATRLAAHLTIDRVHATSQEDGRYRALREHWGAKAHRNFFFFYQGQAFIAVLFSLPLAAAMRGGPVGLVAGLGAFVWAIAVTGETIADRQLARFRRDPANRGQVCQQGLWRYSRHPNYFFEWIHWWTYVLIGGGALLTWIGPVVMLVFLFRVTGIPYTELQAVRSRGEQYRRYQQTTNAFFPWFPRKLDH